MATTRDDEIDCYCDGIGERRQCEAEQRCLMDDGMEISPERVRTVFDGDGLVALLDKVTALPRTMVTYQIAADRSHINCLVCGSRSYSPKDVMHCYCGRCSFFHARPPQ